MKGKQMSKKTKEPDALACRRNKVGGQAVLEGVMMKSGERVCIAVRKPDGSIEKQTDSFVSVRKKHKFLNIARSDKFHRDDEALLFDSFKIGRNARHGGGRDEI